MRIGIVNDIALAVEAIRRVILESKQHTVAWVANDGAQAVEQCSRDTPDLVLMDLLMPCMDGVEATRRIMAQTPCPILIVTADVAGNSAKVFEAMGAGALDVVNTPVLHGSGSSKTSTALLAKLNTVRALLGLAKSPGVAAPAPQNWLRSPARPKTLIAIGASAGGPTALAKLLSGLPDDFSAPIVVVQHVDSQFTQGLANWLDYQTPLRVRLAQDGEEPESGTVLLAGRDSHLVFTAGRRLDYRAEPADCAYRPSIDVFFKSALGFWRGDIIGLLLTGMGRDGAEGLQALHRDGHHTIIQDQTSSAVYGMPKAAADLRAASESLALGRIAPRLIELLARSARIHV